MKTEIIGNFEIKTDNIEIVLEKIFRRHTKGFDHSIAHQEFIPKCMIGLDDKGISIVSLKDHGYGCENDWYVWHRSDYQTRNYNDLHSVVPITVFDGPSPGKADIEVEFPKNIIDLCKYAYGQTGRMLEDIREAIKGSGDNR